MNIKWLGFIIFVWIIATLMAATFDEASSDASTWGPENETTLSYLADIRRVVYAEEETGTFAWLTPNTEYFNAAYELMTWDFGFLKCSSGNDDCGYTYFRYIVLVPISLTALFGLLYIFITLLQGFIPGSS